MRNEKTVDELLETLELAYSFYVFCEKIVVCHHL